MDFRSQIKEKKCSVIVVERVLRYSNQEKKDFDEISIANAEEIYLFGKWILLSELEKPCEWAVQKFNKIYATCDKSYIDKERIYDRLKFKFCPFCGRPIKEV